MDEPFVDFFRRATGGHDPYPYQVRFAEAPELPHLLRAPTGAGKTATAVLGWLYRWKTEKPGTPRRLVYCLPMRVLIEQSFVATLGWLHRLDILDAQLDFAPDDPKQVAAYRPRLDEATAGKVAVYRLMGGVDAEEWYLHPERPMVLIGTQDMLLSRALNRGYAASRFHWPIDFGLLNDDCLWVFDEPQLMANGVSTSAQLAGLRAQLGTWAACPSVWMSATLEPAWLETVDFRGRFTAPPLELAAEDYDSRYPLHKRMTATKTLGRLDAEATKDGKPVAREVLNKHQAGTQTLVVLNTVERAKAVYAELVKLRKKADSPKLLLVHSRFRPAEREELNETLTDSTAAADRVIVATQVVEAGVDLSRGRTLVTELAPWASIVQRIGRCNRTGDDGPGLVFWIDLDAKMSLPYSEADLGFAGEQLRKLDGRDVSPKALDEFKQAEGIVLPFAHTHVVRRRDVLDLFDTAPDLSGNDIDVSRFVRSDDPDTDVQVFWRDVPEGGPPPDAPQPVRRELCAVPVGQARDFLKGLFDKKRGAGYVWDHLEGLWDELPLARLRPGLQILLPATAGGYSDLGWDKESTDPVDPVPLGSDEAKPCEAAGSDLNSETDVPLTIPQHTSNVCRELDALLGAVASLPAGWVGHLRTAARWHDTGKGHEAFQKGVRSVNDQLEPNQLYAKSGRKGRMRHGRRHFRHELVSALAALQHGQPFEAVYLTGSHHGRVRLGIRTLPEEDQPPDPATPFALGVWEGDRVGPVELGAGTVCPQTVLSLGPMRLGGVESWTARALALLAALGPFRLAYLEALLRAADVRASRKEAGHA